MRWRVGIQVQALANDHVGAVLDACSEWQELAAFGPPYWRPRSEAELRRKIAAAAGPTLATEYSFVLEDDGRLVGECSLHAIDWRSRLAQVGVCVWSPADRRSGFGQFGVEQMITWGLDYLGLQRLEAWIVEGNSGSVALFQRLGFEHEGTLRQRYQHAGRRLDMEVYGLLSGV